MPFIAINCGAIPENLFESELFGYKKGSFTGAFSDKSGKIEEAHGGTLFLDEIGELPPQMQTKLLRVIQERKVQRIGENTERDVDIRIITATNKDLKKHVESGDFREDLYYRINVIPINIRPLRERKEDIIPLIKHFSNSKSYGKLSFDKEAMDELVKYSWPGNVRELVNIVERVSVFFQHSVVTKENIIDILGFDEIKVSTIVSDFEASSDVVNEELPIKALNTTGLKDAVKNFESRIIMEALEDNGWKVTKASEVLGVKRTTLLEKIKRLGLSK
jgi:transcriptional regulator with PAS, ATPase and Fis domain